MKKARKKGSVNVGRWMSYAAAGAAATAATREAGAAYQYYYSGVINYTIQTNSGSGGPPPIPANKQFTTLAGGTSWFIGITNNQFGSHPRNKAKDYVQMPFSAVGSLVGFQHGTKFYASNLGAGVKVKPLAFVKSNMLMADASYAGSYKWNVPAGTTGFLGFEIDETVGPQQGEYWGWVKIMMTQGAPHHGIEVISFAYANDPNIVTGQFAPSPEPASLLLLGLGAGGLLAYRQRQARKKKAEVV